MEMLDGKKVADIILEKIKREIKSEKADPMLAVILIGNDEASELYVKIKKRRAGEVGIGFSLSRFNEESSEKEIIKKINELNEDKKINGIIVQLPLPNKFNTQKIICSVDPLKDVDGFSAQGGKNILEPVFPKAIIKLLESSNQNLENKKAIVIANSELFGEMMLKALEKKNIEGEYILSKNIMADLELVHPTLPIRLLRRDDGQFLNRASEESDCHSRMHKPFNLKKIKEADILITAIGEKEIIKGGMLKEGAIVIDGGISEEDKKVFGDVDAESVKDISGFITPVPGGVGPVTVACLLQNVRVAFENQNGG